MKKTAKNDVTGDWLHSKPNSEMFEKNFDAIFRKNKDLDPITKPFPHNILRPESSRIDVVGQNGNDGLHYDKAWDEMKPVGKEILPEYELNKSTGEVQKKNGDN
jgi:hypothetical protein